MRILSQDKNLVIDLSSGGYLNAYGEDVCFTSYGGKFTDLIIGGYETVERAKEVLTELFHCQYEGFVMPEV